MVREKIGSGDATSVRISRSLSGWPPLPGLPPATRAALTRNTGGQGVHLIQACPVTVTPLATAKTVTISGVSLYPMIFHCKLDKFAGEKTVTVAGMAL